jgi:chromosome partitioning protein
MGKPIIVSVINNKGGVGKTSVTLNLGSVLSDNYKVLIIDNDRQANSTGVLLEGIFPEDKNLISLYQNKEFNIVKVFDNTPIKKELYLLPGSPGIEEIRSVIDGKIEREKIISKKIQDIAKGYDFVLIDNPPALDVFSYNALYASDFALIPFKPGALEFSGMQNLLTALAAMKERGHGIELLGVLVNMYNSRTKAAIKYIEMLLKIIPEEKLFDTMISVSQDFINAIMDSLPIDLYPDANKAVVNTYYQLADEFVHKLTNFKKEEN